MVLDMKTYSNCNQKSVLRMHKNLYCYYSLYVVEVVVLVGV